MTPPIPIHTAGECSSALRINRSENNIFDIISSDDDNSIEVFEEDEDSLVGGYDFGDSTMERSNDEVDAAAHDDTAPVFILQPHEIVRNINNMRQLATLMETRLQSTAVIRRLNEGKLRAICEHIVQFPGAFNKFIQIIHQIQYLNVTHGWDPFNHGLSNLPSSSSIRDAFYKLFCFKRQEFHSTLALYDARKWILLHLLDTMHQVFHRYMQIQLSYEGRLRRFRDLILAPPNPDSDDDDPNLPLLLPRRRLSGRSRGVWLERVETSDGILRTTRGSAEEVKDTIRILHNLILWDHSQLVFAALAQPLISGGNLDLERRGFSDIQTDYEFLQFTNGRRRMWTLVIAVIAIVIVLVAVAGLSFLKFHY